MKRLSAITHSSRRWKLALLLSAFVGALAAMDSGPTRRRAAATRSTPVPTRPTGLLRVSSNGTCLPSEHALQPTRGLPGPAGPPGNTDSTVRHISNFMSDGTTVSTLILANWRDRHALTALRPRRQRQQRRDHVHPEQRPVVPEPCHLLFPAGPEFPDGRDLRPGHVPLGEHARGQHHLRSHDRGRAGISGQAHG